MNKTLLRISLSACAAATLVLASCEQPTSYDVSYGNIGGVQNLKVKGYIGANLITWDPLADAQNGYDIYRKEKPKDGDWGEYRELGSVGNTAVSYVDAIADNNILNDESEYTYRVIAKAKAESVLSNSAAEVSYKTDKDGEESPFKSSLQFPAKDQFPQVGITNAKITVDNIYGQAFLTWTGLDNPAIEYTIGNSASTGFPTNSWTRTAGTTTATATANIVTAGMIDARITARFKGGYYTTSSVAAYVDPVAYNVQHLDSITANIASATRQTGDKSKAIVTYTKVQGATAYILQRAKTNSTGSILTWIDVPTTTATDLGAQFQVIDTLPAADANAGWEYRLFVRTANGISNATSRTLTLNGLRQVSITVSSTVSSILDGDTSDGLDAARNKFEIRVVDPEAGVSYQLYVQTVGDANGSVFGSFTSSDDVGEWKLSGAALTPAIDNVPIIFSFDPANQQRQSYNFAVLAKKAGYEDRFIARNNATATKSQLTVSTPTINNNNIVTITLWLNNSTTVTSLQANESVEVYARRSTGTAYELVHTVTAPAAGSPLVLSKDIGSAGTGSAYWQAFSAKIVIK